MTRPASKWEKGAEPRATSIVSTLSSVSPKTPPPVAVALSSTGQILLTLAKSDVAKFTAFFNRVKQAYPEDVTRVCLKHLAGGERKAGEQLEAEPSAGEQGTGEENTAEHSSAEKCMAEWLANESGYIELLFDPKFLDAEEARRAMGTMRLRDAKFSMKLSRALTESKEPDWVVRALTLLENIEDYSAFYPRL